MHSVSADGGSGDSSASERPERRRPVTPLVVPKANGSRDLVRQLAEALNTLTRARAALTHASAELLHVRYYDDDAYVRAIEAWGERRRMLEALDTDIRDLALAIQEQGER